MKYLDLIKSILIKWITCLGIHLQYPNHIFKAQNGGFCVFFYLIKLVVYRGSGKCCPVVLLFLHPWTTEQSVSLWVRDRCLLSLIQISVALTSISENGFGKPTGAAELVPQWLRDRKTSRQRQIRQSLRRQRTQGNLTHFPQFFQFQHE